MRKKDRAVVGSATKDAIYMCLSTPIGDGILGLAISALPSWDSQLEKREEGDLKDLFQTLWRATTLPKLVELRPRSVRRLTEWVGAEISLVEQTGPHSLSSTMRRFLVDANPDFVTLEDLKGDRRLIPLKQLEIGFDHETDRLKLTLKYS